jgi:phage portal protein BeeE
VDRAHVPGGAAALWKKDADGQEEQVRDHEMLRLLRRPNPHYTGPILWMATIVDWNVDGNAYWLKIRDRAAGPRAVVGAALDDGAAGDENTFITHYDYRGRPNGDFFRGEATGDPADPTTSSTSGSASTRTTAKGYSPLKSVLREVFTDDEAANFTAALLRNMGVPGLVVSRPGEPGVHAERGRREATKAYMKARSPATSAASRS